MDFVDQLTSLSQSLWQEVTHDHLISRYLKVLEDSLGVGPATYLSLRTKDERLIVQDPELVMKRRPGYSPHFITQLEKQLNVAKSSGSDFAEGISTVVVDEHTLEFAILEATDSGPGLVFWEQSEQDSARSKERLAACEFLTRQVQNSLRWLTRLDKTEALLHRDDLTGLYNYRYLDLALDSEIRRAVRFTSSFCLLFIDLDEFKPINDRFGHQAGSSVLMQVAQVLRETLRNVDSVFRYGGDEYVVLLVESTPQIGLLAGERIRKAIADYPFKIDGNPPQRLTASIGVASCPEHGMDKESLIHAADAAMYRSKHSGKNKVTMSPREGLDDRRTLPQGLRK